MNAIVRAGVMVVAAAVLAGCNPGNTKAVYHVDNVVNRPETRVDFVATDALLRGRTIITRTAPDPDQPGATKQIVFVCNDAPPDVYALIGGNLSANLTAKDSKPLDASLTAGVVGALSASGAQIQKTASQRRMDAMNEATCNMYQGGAITNRQYMVQQLINARMSAAFSGIDAITALVSPPPPPPTIIINAPGGTGTAGAATTDGSGNGTGKQGSTAATPTSLDQSGLDKFLGDAGAIIKYKAAQKACDAGAADQKAGCEKDAMVAAGIVAAQDPPKPSQQASPPDDSKPPAAVTIDATTRIKAIGAIQQLAEEAMILDVGDVTCLLDQAEHPLSEEQHRISCPSGASADAKTNPASPEPPQALKSAFNGTRLYVQVATEAQRQLGTQLVQKLIEKFGRVMAIGSVEVRRGPSVVQIRYYGQTAAKDDTTDPRYTAATALQAQLKGVFTPGDIDVENWFVGVANQPSPGLMELWIPADVKINPSALARTIQPVENRQRTAAGGK